MSDGAPNVRRPLMWICEYSDVDTVSTPRLGTITWGQIQAALDRFDLGSLITAEPARTGNFGQNLFLTSDCGRFVLRGNPLTEGQFAKERHFAQIFHERCEVPAPWPYHHEPSSDLFGWPYVIMGQIDGIHVAEPEVYDSLDTTDRLELAAGIGNAAAQIGAVRVDRHGRWDAGTGLIVPFRPHWEGWVRATILEQVDRCQSIQPTDREWIVALLERATPALRQPFAASLIHGDLSRHNVIATRSSTGLTVGGVYDLSSAHFGHADVDLTRQFADYLDHDPPAAPVFLRAGTQDFADFAPDRFRALLVLERIGIWEWATRESLGWWDVALTFREWLGRYLDAVPS